ncbi:hypothetical protein WG66_009196 [Moniliophthora roreri]|nr:hypothetical protein WG66_009196 [Moniliophthora roreri]
MAGLPVFALLAPITVASSSNKPNKRPLHTSTSATTVDLPYTLMSPSIVGRLAVCGMMGPLCVDHGLSADLLYGINASRSDRGYGEA